MRTATKARLFFLAVTFSTIFGMQAFAADPLAKEIVGDLVALTAKVNAGTITSGTALKGSKILTSSTGAALLATHADSLFAAMKAGTITEATLKEFQASAGSLTGSQLMSAIQTAKTEGTVLTSTNLAKLAAANQASGTGLPGARPAAASNDVFATSANASDAGGILGFDCKGVASCVAAQKSVMTSSGTAINPSAPNLTTANRLFAAAGEPLVKACGGDGACVTDGYEFLGNYLMNPANFVVNEKSADLAREVLDGRLAAEGAVPQKRLNSGAKQAAKSCSLTDTRPACLCVRNGKNALANAKTPDFTLAP